MESYVCLRTLSAIVIFLAISARSQDAGCPIHFRRHADSCYHVFTSPSLTWWDAMAFCSNYGNGLESYATLATIETEDEQLFLEGVLKKEFGSTGYDFWLGANDLDNEGTWVWVKRNQYVSGYTRWAVGQPSSGTAENCLGIYPGVNYLWNDAPCGTLEAFICEIPYNGDVTSEIVG